MVKAKTYRSSTNSDVLHYQIDRIYCGDRGARKLVEDLMKVHYSN